MVVVLFVVVVGFGGVFFVVLFVFPPDVYLTRVF